MDVVAPCVPTGLAAGRIGNFINGELWGRAADPSLPWAMVFPQSGSNVPRHPSQLYQFALEGLLLFALLWWYGQRERARGQVAAAFVFGYGVLRFVAEYFREPDSFLGLLALGMSMGQWLCLPMIAAGALLWWWFGRDGGAATIAAMRQVFLDTETTGLDAANGDRIIEIGCIEMVDRRHYRPPPAPLRQPAARPATPTRCACTASPTTSWPTSRCSRPWPTNCWPSWPAPRS